MSEPEKGYHSVLEERVLPQLRARFERLGYAFALQPDAKSLPAFMEGYIPDAVARKGDENVAIEIKGRHAQGDPSILRLYKLFEGQPDWRLAVVFGGDEFADGDLLAAPDLGAIVVTAEQVRSLADGGFGSAALVMSFALLEATIRAVADQSDPRPQKPGTVVQSLAADGYVDRESEVRLMGLVKIRNGIVHGDLSSAVAPSEAKFVVSVCEKALAQRFAV